MRHSYPTAADNGLRLAVGLLLALTALGCPALQSHYTDISYRNQDCRLTAEEEEGAYARFRCPAIAGYSLDIEDGDLRMSITVVDPDGVAHPLNFWSTVTGRFSTLGETAEWIVDETRGGRPIALIVRVNAASNDDIPEASYLAVSRLSGDPWCVTARIEPVRDANVRAREAAARAATASCLGPPSD